MSSASGTAPDLAAEVAALEWYHTIELAPGIKTPGWHDTRPIVGEVPLPASLAGKRCLDVGTFDGFWAFEMERRGAAEVLAIDILDPEEWDWPAGSESAVLEAIGRRKGAGRGFEIAHRELGSSVRRIERSVYDVNEDELGRFDVVYLGSLLVHLRDPVRALERLRSVCDGTMVVVDGIDLLLSIAMPRLPVATLDGRGRPWWWYPNQAALRRLIEAGGFEVIDGPRRLFMPPGAGQTLARFDPRLLRTRDGRHALIVARWGDPHAVVGARPRRFDAS
jgi:tRNA (mo5U34)-methyltransferase